jgi:hypothetical protein
MEEVIPGVLHWQAYNPNIRADVSSYLLTDTGTALDPLLPEGEGPEWLGHEVQRVVMTVRHHTRSVTAFRVPVLAHRAGLHDLSGLDVEPYDDGDELAPGVRALPFGRICPDDAVIHADVGPGVLAFGDGIINYGGIGVVPDHLLGNDPQNVRTSIVNGLVPLLEEEFDVLLFAHGTPIASGGKDALRQFVESA